MRSFTILTTLFPCFDGFYGSLASLLVRLAVLSRLCLAVFATVFPDALAVY